MTFTGLLIAGLFLEAFIYSLAPLWQYRKIFIWPVVLLTIFPVLAVSVSDFGIFSMLLIYVSAFRIFNQIKIFKSRTNEIYLKRAARLSGIVLGLSTLAVIYLDGNVLFQLSDLILIAAVSQYVFAAVVYLSVSRNLRKMSVGSNIKSHSDDELPTVTVAVPARNETDELKDCLRSLLASDYPKLEILVLDDCSHDKTAEVIKSFAHKGVRFIKGEEPNDNWLAKNLAYYKLESHSSGELILFSGVDVNFGRSAIRTIVNELLSRKKSMASILPTRNDGKISDSLIQIARYWWELALPRRFFNRPPVLSTCWIIEREKLKKLGGFAAVKRSILPESFFARELAREDGYSFLRAGNELGVQTTKSSGDSKDTAIRVKYPQLRKRPELVMFIALFEIALVFGPFAVVILGLFASIDIAFYLALLASLVLLLSQTKILKAVNGRNSSFRSLFLPVLALVDAALLIVSMYQYEFATVEWKERNICIPVMHVYPKLPDMDKKSAA